MKPNCAEQPLNRHLIYKTIKLYLYNDIFDFSEISTICFAEYTERLHENGEECCE